MAGSQQVQEYLQTHKIGNLFEDLMAKVVSDMPDDPIVYLIQTLERKATRMGTKPLRKSMGDIGGVAVAKDRPYSKPWQTNTKRQKNKKLSETDPAPRRPKTASERPDWDGTVKGAAANLDEFWGDGEAIGKPQGRESSPVRGRARTSWADEEDEELLYRSQGYAGPRQLYDTETDPLSGEFGLSKDQTTNKKQAVSRVLSGRVRGPAADALKHRQELARLVQAGQPQTDSGIEDDRDLDADDAVELLEDPDDLRSEGVKKIKNSGIRVKPMRRSGAAVEPQVRVSICARCAKVMSGGSPSELAEGVRYGELPDFDVDSDREFAESRPQSTARYTDDEFESVSQVSGPRRPVWQEEESEDETPKARNGQHMFTSRGIPNKGRPMYSAEPTERGKTSKQAAGDVYRSVDTATSAKTLEGHSSFNRTWTEGVGQSEDEPKQKDVVKENVEKESEVAKENEDEPPTKAVTFRSDEFETPGRTTAQSTSRQQDDDDESATMSLRGDGWAPPPTDYDSDFSAPPPQASRSRGKVRQYQGQY